MTEIAIEPAALLEVLPALADRARLEIRVLPVAITRPEFAPTESAACRVGDRIWVVLAPDDPALHQAEVLAGALLRFRSDFLEDTYLAPGVREFVEQLGD